MTIFGALAGLFAILGFGVYRFQRLKRESLNQELETTKIQATLDATRAKMEGEQKERQTIASTLHDQVASLLTAADMHLKVARKETPKSPLWKMRLQFSKALITRFEICHINWCHPP